jgi:hypothetical protein
MAEESTLGINIKPSEVRLSPGLNDPYAWKILPEKHRAFSEIFSKNLSQHSINAYKALCDGVGVSFEAIRASTNDTSRLDHLTSVSQMRRSCQVSLTARCSYNRTTLASARRSTNFKV